MAKIVEKKDEIYNIYVIKNVKGVDDSDVPVKELENSLTLEQINYHRDEAQKKLDEWNDILNQTK